MKKILFIFCLSLIAVIQTNSQTNTFPTSGNVGIGTTSPNSKLDISYGGGSSTIAGMRIFGGGAVYENIALSLDDTGTASNNINILEFKNASLRSAIIKSINPSSNNATGGNLILETTSSNNGTLNANQLVLSNNGNVGIGTNNPTHKLDIITGGGHLKTYLYGLEHTVNTSGGWARGFRLRNEYDNKTAVFGSLSGTAYISTGFDINSDATGYGNQKLTVLTNGNVGIGTTTPDAKLAVKGNIHTNEVKVDLLGDVAPDYVFYKDYDLKTLTEVENYITKEGHLPNIPSAKEMEANGLLLKEMNLKLLEKIEELTLYTISQEKRINTLEQENNTLKEQQKRIKLLEEQMALLLKIKE